MSLKPELFPQFFPTSIIDDVFCENVMVFSSLPLYWAPSLPSQGHEYTQLEPRLQMMHCGQCCQIQRIKMQNPYLNLNFRYTTNNCLVQICLMSCVWHIYIKTYLLLHKIQIGSVLSIFFWHNHGEEWSSTGPLLSHTLLPVKAELKLM